MSTTALGRGVRQFVARVRTSNHSLSEARTSRARLERQEEGISRQIDELTDDINQLETNEQNLKERLVEASLANEQELDRRRTIAAELTLARKELQHTRQELSMAQQEYDAAATEYQLKHDHHMWLDQQATSLASKIASEEKQRNTHHQHLLNVMQSIEEHTTMLSSLKNELASMKSVVYDSLAHARHVSARTRQTPRGLPTHFLPDNNHHHQAQHQQEDGDDDDLVGTAIYHGHGRNTAMATAAPSSTATPATAPVVDDTITLRAPPHHAPSASTTSLPAVTVPITAAATTAPLQW